MVDHYNLYMIISIGYRVNSKRGTQFRIWANKILKEYLVKGYTINEKRLKEQTTQLEELKQTAKLLDNVLQSQPLNSNEATGLLKSCSILRRLPMKKSDNFMWPLPGLKPTCSYITRASIFSPFPQMGFSMTRIQTCIPNPGK